MTFHSINSILGLVQAPQVSEQPDMMLINWSVFQLTLPNATDDLIVGVNPVTNLCRVSTRIRTINLTPPSLYTQSGRRYVLKGSPCIDPHVMSVWYSLFGDVPHQNVSEAYRFLAITDGEHS